LPIKSDAVAVLEISFDEKEKPFFGGNAYGTNAL
jgi:hypothetical protein